jgi:shikimate kinase
MGNHSGSLPDISLSAQRRVQEIRVIFLVGFMGAGKTTVGRELAQRLGWAFEDLDDRVQSREGRMIDEIFQNSGEAEFRRYEHLALRELLLGTESSPRVIALGGGAFAQPENAALLKHTAGPSVFLSAPVEELYRRCQQQELKRPLRQHEAQFRKLYEQRHALYLKATFHVETNGKDVPAIVAEIAQQLGLLRQQEILRD